jgi:hypothetical protein
VDVGELRDQHQPTLTGTRGCDRARRVGHSSTVRKDSI